MPELNTAERLRAWLRGCPAIQGVNRFGVDFMGQDPTEYAIYSVPTQVAYKTDILGDVYPAPIQELNYIFACRQPFSLDILQSLENLGFFAQVMEWIYARNTARDFPEIAEGKVVSIMPTLSPYVFEAGGKSGRYQIQLKLTYRR